MVGRLKALVAGFVIGIFIAPRSGRASRQLLRERINEFFEMGTRRLEALEDELTVRRSSRSGDYDDEGRSAVETGVDPIGDEPVV